MKSHQSIQDVEQAKTLIRFPLYICLEAFGLILSDWNFLVRRSPILLKNHADRVAGNIGKQIIPKNRSIAVSRNSTVIKIS